VRPPRPRLWEGPYIPPRRYAPPPPFVCQTCDSRVFAESVLDEGRCIRCARGLPAWKPVCFGRIRKVPSRLAKRWE